MPALSAEFSSCVITIILSDAMVYACEVGGKTKIATRKISCHNAKRYIINTSFII